MSGQLDSRPSVAALIPGAAWLPMAAIAFLTLAALASSVDAVQPVASEGLKAEACADCHPDVVSAFAKGPHGRAMARTSSEILDGSCVSCHGPGEVHVDDPVPENIGGAPGEDACVTCHSDRAGQLGLATPGHRRHAVECLDCHASGHGEDLPVRHLLADEPYKLCGGCHGIEAGRFQLPFAHRDGREPFECTECHSAHGLERVTRLLLEDSGGACLDCHTEKRGPFVFPHPPRAIHGCSECHQPHGSTNPRLLERRDVLATCLECHADVPAFHDITQPRYRRCVSCHPAVHGSNRDPLLFDD